MKLVDGLPTIKRKDLKNSKVEYENFNQGVWTKVTLPCEFECRFLGRLTKTDAVKNATYHKNK